VSANPVLEAALLTQAACDAAGLAGCVIGGIALQRWGEPRYTADADLSVLVEPGRESAVIADLLSRLPARIPDAAQFAERTRVILAQSPAGVAIDLVLAGLPFEARVIERASAWDLGGGLRLRTCSAEDLLVMKVFAGRDKDWADVTSILERGGAKLDLERVREELRPLLAAKEAPEAADEFERRVARHWQA
jgi:hypothetical protein